MKLFEGMRHGDLEDLVLPMISVDEYESKLDDSAIVIGFYVRDKDAADDLNRFIQKSAVELLDSEVSPAPDQHSYYLVFVELLNDNKVVDNIEQILEEVSPLIADDHWQMQIRGIDKVLPFERKVLTKRFNELRNELEKRQETEEDTDAQVVEFLIRSDLSSALVEDERVELNSPHGRLRAVIAGIGLMEHVIVDNDLQNTPLSLAFGDASESKRISQMLGEGWSSTRIGDHTLLQRTDSEFALLLRCARFD